ncbi:hypothetical protein C8T65DRAFT_595186, partial [Cerioporus squamosus]
LQRVVSLGRRAVIYETQDTRPRLILLGTDDDWDPACGSLPCTEDFDSEDWFPTREAISHVEFFPATRCHLGNGYDIIALRKAVKASTSTRRRQAGPPNETLRNMFSIEWPGNLIVMKRARYDRSRVVHITQAEISLINTVVQRSVSSRY